MVEAQIDILTYISMDIEDSDEPDRGVSRMEVGERMWEVLEEFGITVNLMLMSETDEDRDIYYDQAVDSMHKVTYLMGLEAYMQSQNYNKDVTPGEEDDIMDLLEELYDEREVEEVNKEWLEDNSEDLESSMQELMSDQDLMLVDLANTKKMLKD